MCAAERPRFWNREPDLQPQRVRDRAEGARMGVRGQAQTDQSEDARQG